VGNDVRTQILSGKACKIIEDKRHISGTPKDKNGILENFKLFFSNEFLGI
jgi:hypothetical protein